MCQCEACSCCGKTKSFEAGMHRIKQDRGCTDILFLLLWLVGWAGTFVILFMARQEGADPWRVIRGQDLDGGVCGMGNKTDYPYLAFPNPIDPSGSYLPVCVESCEATNQYGNNTYNKPRLTKMVYRYESSRVGYYCLPTAGALSLIPTVNLEWQQSDITTMIGQAVTDVTVSARAICVAIALSIIVTFMFVALLGKCAGCIVLMAIILILGGCTLFSAYLIYWGKLQANIDATPNYAYAAYVSGIVLACIVFLTICVLLALYTRIRIAVEVVKQAAAAVGDMKCIICFPIYPFIFCVAYLVLWAAAMVYVWSVQTVGPLTTTPTALTQLASFPTSMWDSVNLKIQLGSTDMPYNANPTSYYPTSRTNFWLSLSAYLVFHALWMIQFFFYFGFITFAGATADWYFTPIDGDGEGRKIIGTKEINGVNVEGLSHCPVCKSCCRNVRYHLGTVALSALIIAIIQMARLILLYIERKTAGKPPNKLQEAIFCMIQCCLKCLQCCMDKINKNALIWTSITGDNFGTAACSSFGLLIQNIGRTIAIMAVSSILLALTKIAVAATTAGIALVVIPRVYPEIVSPYAPAIIVFIGAYIVCSVFMVVFNAMIDTIFLCFLIDEQMNKPPNQMMADKDLSSLVRDNDDFKTESENAGTEFNERRRRLDERLGKLQKKAKVEAEKVAEKAGY
jgi:hypothetical protein